MTDPVFVHLLTHTEYSLVDGLVRVKPLVAAAAELGMPAVAVTDQSNLFALVKFYKAAAAVGVKPIFGVEFRLLDSEELQRPFRLIMLVQNREGYGNLTRLISRSYREGQASGVPLLQREWLEGHCAGLIALSGGAEGDLGRALLNGHEERARELLAGWLRLFGDRYYLELRRTGRPGEEEYLHAAVALATEQQVPVVATNDVRFIRRDDFHAHEVRVCIHEGRTLDDPRRPKLYSEQQYLRSPEEMAELFSDLPEALANSVEIARRCTLELVLGKNFLPDFPIPEGMTEAEYFRAESHKGLEWRLARVLPPGSAEYAARRKVYEERLEIELGVIITMGFPGYFLIVADFIQWAKDHQVPVGPGRGSGAGSLVAWVLKITDLDPIEHDLLFERFLNPERVSMPDFDIDFCMEGRDRVIDYVAQKYGRDSVSQIITYGSMAAKAVVRDVGRVLGHPYGFVDRIAKMIPFEVGMTLAKALQESEDLQRTYDNEEEVSELIDMARKLEGLARNAGKHAGGVVIAPGLLTDFAPLYCEAGSQQIVTQFDKDDVEQVGLVKFDFLGLRTLTIVDWALRTVNAERTAAGEAAIDISAIPMDDPAAFALLKACNTTAVFQLESRGMKELIKKLQPDCFEDITALVALFRPGPLQSGMVDDFIDRKHGRAKVEYPHPALEPILKPTYGVILYQEQVMQIAQVLAGYSLGGADLLRRAMGKKKPEEMAKQGEIFRQGAVERGVEEGSAKYIFELMEKFAGYGFNKSHSAAYALVSYQTMWLKAHYPAAFMAAVLSADMDHTDKVVTMIEDTRALQLQVNPPDINRSQYKFTTSGRDTVIYGLGAIKGVGEAAIGGMIEERERHGAYRDLFDFCRRIDLRRANRRVLESLIKAGAMDRLGENRATLIDHLPLAIQMAEQHHATSAAGQNDLFAAGAQPDIPPEIDPQLLPPALPEWEDEERLRGEKETLGLYLTGHPIDRYEHDLKALGITRIKDLSLEEAKANSSYGRRNKAPTVLIAGLVVAVAQRKTQRGRMASVLVDDRTGRSEVVLFGDAYESQRDKLAADRVLVVSGSLSYDEYREALSIRGETLLGIDEVREQWGHRLQLQIDSSTLQSNGAELVTTLQQLLTPFRGGNCAIVAHYRSPQGEAVLEFGPSWRIRPQEQLLTRLQKLLGEGQVLLHYRRPTLQRSEGTSPTG